MKRLLTIVSTLCLLLSCTALPSAAINYDRTHRLSVVSEPDALPADGIRYYRGEEQIAADELTWVDNGYDGKALHLAGDGTFLRLDYTVARVTAFTFSAWVNWQGGESGQRLFSIARGNDNYLTFSPYMHDTALYQNSGFANGVHLRYQFGGENGTVLDLFNPTDETISYALPRGEWHHVAVTSDARTVQVYIDGVLWLEDRMMTSIYELNAHSLDIGTGEWGDPTLNALLDNVELYRKVLSVSEIQTLAGYSEEGNVVYLPTEPSTTTATTTTTTTTTTTEPARQTLGKTLFGVPMWGVYTLGGIVAAYVTLTVVLNIHDRKRKDGDRR